MGHNAPGVIHAVALHAPNELVLLELGSLLREADIPHVIVAEPDSPWNGQVMAIGLAITKDRAKLRPFLKKLKLCAGSSVVETPEASAKSKGPVQ